MAERLLLAAEAAELAGVAPSTWRSYVARGQAPRPVRRTGSTPQWSEAQVRRWMENRPGAGSRSTKRARDRARERAKSRSESG